jgi:hypothetical protein
MARIISLPRALRSVRKELGRRLRNAGLTAGSLRIETESGAAALRLSRGEVTVNRQHRRTMPTLSLPQPLLTQALMGVRCPEVLLSDERVRSEGEVSPFVEALFRPEIPYMWTADHF